MAAIEQMQDSELATVADQALLAAMANAVVDETLGILEPDTDSEPMVGTESVDYDHDSERGSLGHDEPTANRRDDA
ncbi:hypothetical protein [Arthrobacter polaris]|uniref:hypothetical protein n=1 Tax=Arthrobacter polaris TaxID=2813727 RepID=UPI001F37092B|nr:hypothetical protein [Arthrobacter polaris]UIK87919.1 hypothetical protein J0916_10570 [Arthrobacter polaris]